MADGIRQLSDDEALCYLQRYAPELSDSPKGEKIKMARDHYKSTGVMNNLSAACPLDDKTAILYMGEYNLASTDDAKRHWIEAGWFRPDQFTSNYADLVRSRRMKKSSTSSPSPRVKEYYTSEIISPYTNHSDEYPRLRRAYPNLEQEYCSCDQ